MSLMVSQVAMGEVALPPTAAEASAVAMAAATETPLAPAANPPGGKFISHQQWVSSLSTLIHDKL